MCTLGFRGRGYSPAFVENFKDLKSKITQNPETQIEIQSHTDHICGPCPHNVGHGKCTKQKKIESLDERHMKALELYDGMIMTWRDALNRIQAHMSIENFHKSCEGCEWKSYGVCEEELNKLINSISEKNEQPI